MKLSKENWYVHNLEAYEGIMTSHIKSGYVGEYEGERLFNSNGPKKPKY